jgi:ABC-type transporter Mla MlaB component
MPYEIHSTDGGLILELSGCLTVRDAAELGKAVAESLTSTAAVTVRTAKLDDVDTTILQLLVSLKKTAANFVLEDPSNAFVSAVDRCSLRRELAAGGRDES